MTSQKCFINSTQIIHVPTGVSPSSIFSISVSGLSSIFPLILDIFCMILFASFSFPDATNQAGDSSNNLEVCKGNKLLLSC